jgi:DNA-binding GntR family transcriptional regulator
MTNNKTTIADRVFDTLCTAIVEGEIAAGSKISEPELAKRLEVSRASLREAIGRLEACSLVTRKANIGARVVSLSKEKLLEIYHVREALEGMAARLAAQNITAQEITQLQQLLKRHTDEVNQADGASYFQRSGDLDFHYHIVQSSHNERLISLLCNDLYHLMRMYRYQFGRVSQRAFPALDEHSYVVSAIADGDGEMAELLMRNHIRRSRRNIEQMMATDQE